MTKAVFIVGNKRSGSTQLMALLNLHPNIFVSNESDIIWILYRFHNNQDIVPYPWDTPVHCHIVSGNHSRLPLHKQLIRRGNPLWLPSKKSLT